MENNNKSFKEYTCEICNKKYSSYQSLWIHNKKYHITKSKHENKPESKHSGKHNETVEYKCNNCNKIYKHKQSKWRHEKKCNEKNIIIDNKLLQLEKKLDMILTNKQDKDLQKQQEIKGDNNIINSINIINNFNNDNLAYITPSFFKNLLKETLFEEDHHKVLPKVIEEVKFNKDHSENNNVKLKNSKSKYGEVYTNEGWKKIDDKKLIEHLIQKGYQLYIKLSDIHKDQIIKRYIDSNDFFKDNFLNGTIDDNIEATMKDTVIKGTKKLKKYNPIEREKELLKEIII